MSVQKPTHTDIGVSNDLWNVKLTFIGRSLLNLIHFYLSSVGAVHIFSYILGIVVVNRSREHVHFVLSAAPKPRKEIDIQKKDVEEIPQSDNVKPFY